MKPHDFLEAARVPKSVEPQEFGLWTIERRTLHGPDGPSKFWRELIGPCRWLDYTILRRWTLASMHLHLGEIVMEDSERELRRHLPIWLNARGRVLKTGLGLGCVVRGLLANPDVHHVDVVEIDADIIRIIGAEFAGNPRVTIHHADALTWDFGKLRWDYAWHDLHSFDERHLQLMHGDLITRFLPVVEGDRQAAWAFPREVARRLPFQMLGAPKRRAA